MIVYHLSRMKVYYKISNALLTGCKQKDIDRCNSYLILFKYMLSYCYIGTYFQGLLL